MPQLPILKRVRWIVGTVLQFKNAASTLAIFATDGVCYHSYLVRKQSRRRKLRHNLFSHLFSFQVIKQKRLNTEWHCACCHYSIHDDEVSIVCDRCLNWSYLRCTNMENVPKYLKDWFCKYCSSNSTSVCQGRVMRSAYE